MIKTVVYDSLQRTYYQEQCLLQHLGAGNIVHLHTPYSTYLPQYSGGSAFSLGDGLTGGSDFRDGRWQGYWGEDIAVEYDFGSPDWFQSLKQNSISIVQDGSWLPTHCIFTLQPMGLIIK